MKRPLMLTVDDELIDAAKKKGLVLSQIMTEALLDKNKPMKKDFTEACLKVVCSLCGDEVTEGYRCEWRKAAYCTDCHKNVDMSMCCRVMSDVEHIHSRFGEKLEPLVSMEENEKQEEEEDEGP